MDRDYIRIERTPFYGRMKAVVRVNGLVVDIINGNKEYISRVLADEYPDIPISGQAELSHTNFAPGGVYDLEASIEESFFEVSQERNAGTLRPFVEGEPLAVIPRESRSDLRGENGKGGALPADWA